MVRIKVVTGGENRRPDIETSEISRMTSGPVTGCVRTPGIVGEKIQAESNPEPGGDHHLDPVLALALKPDPHGKAKRPELVGEVIAVFAIDPPQAGFPGDIRDAILLVQPVPGWKGDTEASIVERKHFGR